MSFGLSSPVKDTPFAALGRERPECIEVRVAVHPG
jgi:hypothetical protein